MIFCVHFSWLLQDDAFIEKVRKRKITFYSGIELPVELLIEVTMDKSLKPTHYNYVVLKVTGDPIEANEYKDKQLAIENIYLEDEEQP